MLTAHTATYDPVGNRVGVQETINTEGSFGLTYTYDPANQLPDHKPPACHKSKKR